MREPEVLDRGLPELHDLDPRLCPGRADWADWGEDDRPDWIGPKPFSQTHAWPEDVRNGYCRWCEVSQEEVRARFSDWRYEQVIAENTRSLDRLAVAIRHGRLA